MSTPELLQETPVDHPDRTEHEVAHSDPRHQDERPERAAPPAVFVVFGASGDLTQRKLAPALRRLAQRHFLPASFAVVGVARTAMSDDGFRDRMCTAMVDDDGGGGGDGDSGGEGVDHDRDFHDLVRGFHYVTGDYRDPATYERLSTVLAELDRDRGTGGNRLFYLATPPSTFPTVIDQLGRAGLHRPGSPDGFARVVIEKPYGHDAESAQALDRCVHSVFTEPTVYRIDHYLGKETVQNLLALRFANAVFEPIWNRRYVDHVQITVAESAGVGHRGSFYEQAGALRDIVQNHVMQVLALTLIEPPASMDAGGIRDEKVKALRSVAIAGDGKLADHVVVRAQYESGRVNGVEVPSYRQAEGVDPESQTETYVALRLEVDNWRWAGVPFYVRTGKRLPKRVTEVVLQFQPVPHLPFTCQQARGLGPNALVLRIQPDEGITLRFGAKVPGQAFDVRSVTMDFRYGTAFAEKSPEAYERLLLDALMGDATLFLRTDEVEQAWRIVEPLLDAWEQEQLPLASYVAGTWGPAEADQLIESSGRHWQNP